MKRFLLRVWRILPFWVQRLAGSIIRPKHQVAVGLVIFNEQGQLLLCEHTYRCLHPWGLPGGDLKRGEDLVQAAKRELFEETELSIQQARLLLAESSREYPHVNLTYLGTGLSGEFVPSDEVSSIQYFDIDKLPDFFLEHQQTIHRVLTLLGRESGD